jgi:hypothetical protein
MVNIITITLFGLKHDNNNNIVDFRIWWEKYIFYDSVNDLINSGSNIIPVQEFSGLLGGVIISSGIPGPSNSKYS